MSTTIATNDEKLRNPEVRKYKTTDIALAATLILHKEGFLGVEPVTKRSMQRSEIYHFVFEDSSIRSDLVMQYSTENEAIKVLPNAFRQTMRHLKELTKLSGQSRD